MSKDSADLQRAIDALSAGGLVAFPTDTVYALACHAFDAGAIDALFNLKRRPRHQPVAALAASVDMAREALVSDWPREAQLLAERFWPGALTIICPAKVDEVPPSLTGGLDTVGVRMPGHETALALISRFGRPVAATSANHSGESPSISVEQVRDRLLADYPDLVILDEGSARPSGIESTVVNCERHSDGAQNQDLSAVRVSMIRQGPVTASEVEQTIGRPLQQGE